MTGKDYDVVIVGAGISGLSAARYLLSKDANLNIVVLEANVTTYHFSTPLLDRVGGITLTIPLKTENGTDDWDLGAHWVGRSQTHIMKVIEELGLNTHQQYLDGRKYGKDNVVKSYKSDIPTLSILALVDLDIPIKRVQFNIVKSRNHGMVNRHVAGLFSRCRPRQARQELGGMLSLIHL